jgi:outer membrane protein assembly factor BamD (BamD/ComL family)
MASAFIIPISGAVCGVILGIIWGSSIGEILAAPLMNLYAGGEPEGEMVPLYSVAETKRKQGRFTDAISEIRKQLEMFPTDFKGWIMLAEIQAENLLDNAAAQNTVEEIIAHEGRAPEHVAYALTRSAEWHLKLARDRTAAEASFQRIIDSFPDTELSQLAAQRIAHLTPEEMLAQKGDPTVIALKHHTEKVGLEGKVLEIKVSDPAVAAARLVKHLEAHPLDNESREQLALTYADHYKRLDLAADQLEQLIGAPNQQPKHVVRWLNLLADLQVRLGGDQEKTRATLQRIIELYPNSAAAEGAIKRVAYLKLEQNSQQKSQAIKLGNYDQNIGLQGKTPRTRS